jgi:anti-sigma-K factor RskA
MSGDEHRDWHADGGDAASYVLGALDGDEARAFAEHLRECASCREEVAALQPVADALPSAVSQTSAPTELRGRVLTTVRSEAELRNASGRERAGRGAAGSVRTSRERPWRLATAGLALALLAALAVLAFSNGSSHRVIRAQTTVPGAHAALHIDGSRGQLQIEGMPQTPPGRIYEIWVERAGRAHPTDALFNVTSAGRASIGVPGSLAGAGAVMVTAEPRGGSSQPTSPPVIVARLG